MRGRSASLLPLTEGAYRQPHRKQIQEMHLLDLESSLLFMDKCEPLIHSSLRTNWHLQPMQKYRSTQMPLFRGIARSGKRTPSHSQHCSGLLLGGSMFCEGIGESKWNKSLVSGIVQLWRIHGKANQRAGRERHDQPRGSLTVRSPESGVRFSLKTHENHV